MYGMQENRNLVVYRNMRLKYFLLGGRDLEVLVLNQTIFGKTKSIGQTIMQTWMIFSRIS